MYGINSQGSVSIPGAGVGSAGYIGTPDFPGAPGCTDTVALNQLLSLIAKLYDVIEESFPSTETTAAYIAKYTTHARVNPFTYVRFAWMKEHPCQTLYPSEEAALAIKELYLVNGMDWTSDPLILRYFPA